MLTNALNPAAIVLSGYFAEVGHHMQTAIAEHLTAGVLAPQAGGTRVVLSNSVERAAVARSYAKQVIEGAVTRYPTRLQRA